MYVSGVGRGNARVEYETCGCGQLLKLTSSKMMESFCFFLEI